MARVGVARTIGGHSFGETIERGAWSQPTAIEHAVYGLVIDNEQVVMGCPFGCNVGPGQQVAGRQKLPAELIELYTEEEWFGWTSQINQMHRSQLQHSECSYRHLSISVLMPFIA